MNGIYCLSTSHNNDTQLLLRFRSAEFLESILMELKSKRLLIVRNYIQSVAAHYISNLWEVFVITLQINANSICNQNETNSDSIRGNMDCDFYNHGFTIGISKIVHHLFVEAFSSLMMNSTSSNSVPLCFCTQYMGVD